MARLCSVFISSTSEDLKEYRQAARDAVLAVGLNPVMMEYFAASGGPPLGECLSRVSPCDVVVVLKAGRYGWVPPDQPGPDAKSITWLECEHAVSKGRQLLVFIADAPWPVERTEAYRLTAAFNDGTFTPELPDEIQRNVGKLGEFGKWLETGRTRATFKTPDDLHARVVTALHQWLDRHPECRPVGPGRNDPQHYLKWLRDQTATIDIRGLGMGAGEARSFPIEDLYVPLTTPREPSGRGTAELMERAPMELDEALNHRRLVIVGDPGSGKTTFLRLIAFTLAGAALEGGRGVLPDVASVGSVGLLTRLLSFLRPERSKSGDEGLAEFPLFIRVAELAGHIESVHRLKGRQTPQELDSPDWIVHFLAARNAKFGWGLSQEFFVDRLDAGEAIVMLDGLDEAPDRTERERAARLFENATQRFHACRFVVTTRPQTYIGESVLRRFHEARIEPLLPKTVETFLDHWCRGLYPESAPKAEAHRKELSEALRARPEIRNITRNPVMLTALAVVHWNERRLPEQRADLYEAILTWLSRQREARPGREKAERCLTLLGELALAMLTDPKGRQSQVPFTWAAEVLAGEFAGVSEEERNARAAQFLEDESADSGIIVNRGGAIQFWHLTFLEYLAARAIAAQREMDQLALLFAEDRIYRAEWREVVLLLAGILKSKPKVDGLVSAILDHTGNTLREQARSAGLLGAMVSDLKPLDYQPADERYLQLMDAVLGIFDREKAKGVEFAARLEAAEALGQAGDPRLRRENWVRIGAFEIGKYPVTVAEYRTFVEDGGYEHERWWIAGGFRKEAEPGGWEDQKEHPNWPVTDVTWFEAKAYCAWAGVRLPGEAEWERAAAGAEGRAYPWGNEESDATRANYDKGVPGHPTPVGLYPAGSTPEGLQDMAGNVWEWVEDWYDNDKTARVLRGGSWFSDGTYLRCAARLRYQPEGRGDNIGFRVAREVFVP